MLTISVIIPAVNEVAAIARSVQSSWNAGADEVIVVDGGSTDGTCDRARECRATVLCSEPGRAVQQNRGVEEASCDMLVFLHADNFFSPQALQQIRDAVSENGVCYGGFRQRIEASGCRFRVLEWGNAFRARRWGLVYGDQGIFIRRTKFLEIGGFPEFPLMEDVALMRHCRRFGRPAILTGPLMVNARRWQRHGVVRQTLKNWRLLAAYYRGVSPEKLASQYRRHDQAG